MENAQTSDELLVSTISVLPAAGPAMESETVTKTEKLAPPAAEAEAGDNELEQGPATTGATSHGLTDQTNFLPTRQVITVFMGLSVALACSFLDQTM